MDQELLRVADVVLDSRSGGRDALYTYGADPSVGVGDAVFVPLGPRSVLGFVARVRRVVPEELGFPLKSLKPISVRVEGLSLPAHLMDLVTMVARETLCPLSVALGVATPPGVKDRLVTAWILEEGVEDGHPLSPLQEEVLRSLKDSGGTLVVKGKLPPPSEKALKLLRAKGLVRQSLMLQPFQEQRKAANLLRLSPDGAKIESFLKNEGRRRPAQAMTLMRLQATEHGALSPQEIKAMSGVTDTILRSLVEAGLLEKVQESENPRPAPEPNAYQKVALDAICHAVSERANETFLLFGVTGSGKTEVYLRAAGEALRSGRQVLYLVPEIALAAQAIALLRDRFGRSVSILHSELPPKERLQNWSRIRQGESPIVLGARSALFAPLDNLGLIVVDEEHEASYKQESAPRYHAKQLARFLAEKHGCPLVLGSATPSVESFYEAETGSITLLPLPERAAKARLPQVHIEDLSAGYRSGRPSILTDHLHGRMAETFERGEQVILFLNRRAYSSFLMCRDCGHTFVCRNCAVSLSYSRRDRSLRCHHCGFRTHAPEACPDCHGHKLSPIGIGTEKVEEAVRENFPDVTVARLDRDVTQKRGALEETLAGFRSGDIACLVGTQIVAKGLDFPNVTLVGVIAADVSLGIPDFRASERTFQLLSQVAGRAGRGTAPGHVVVQTFNPGHIAVTTAQTHDYVRFYEAVKTEREGAGYPPFRRLVNVVVSGASLPAVKEVADELGDRLQLLEDLEVLGPVECPIERVQGRWRRHLLLKLPPSASVEELGAVVESVNTAEVQVTADVDPYSLM